MESTARLSSALAHLLAADLYCESFALARQSLMSALIQDPGQNRDCRHRAQPKHE
jgi:hypothetical protein